MSWINRHNVFEKATCDHSNRLKPLTNYDVWNASEWNGAIRWRGIWKLFCWWLQLQSTLYRRPNDYWQKIWVFCILYFIPPTNL